MRDAAYFPIVSLCALIALLVVNAGLTYRSFRELLAESASVEHTHNVIDALNKLKDEVNTAEAEERSFLLTANEAAADRFASAMDAAGHTLDRIVDLTADNPEQRSQTPELRKILDTARGLLAFKLEVRREQGFDAVLPLYVQGSGHRALDEFKSAVNAMERRERDLLLVRQEQRRRSYAVGVSTSLLTAASGLAAIGLFAWLLRRHLNAREKAALAIHEREELLQATLISIGDGVIATDTQGRVAFINAVAERLTGWTHREALGRRLEAVFRIVDEATRRPAENPAVRAVREGRVVGLANHTILLAKDGHEWPLDDSAAPIRDRDGRISGAVLVFREISAAKRHEAALRESESQFATLANSIPQLAWMARPDGHVFWYNQRWYEYTGTTFDQMEGWGWQSVHDPQELPRVVEKIKRSFDTGEPWEDLFPLRRHDGEYRWHLSRMLPVRDAEGRILRWFGTNTDITEQRDIEAALRASEERFHQLADAMPQMVWVTRPDGYCEYFNRRWYEFTGASPEECLGHRWSDCLHEDDRERAKQRWREAVTTGEPYEIEYRLRGKDGETRWFLGRALPVHGDDGKIAKWFGACTDIEDARRTADELADSQRFLRSSLDALSSHIAVLDDRGVILTVNEAWRRFAEENGLGSPRFGVGTNYIEQCELGAEHACDERAPSLAEGIRAVIEGRSPSLRLEYPCHSPTEQRWFQMRVTPFGGEGPARVVVAHEDITQRVLSEEAIRRRSRQLQGLAEIAAKLNVAHEVNEILDEVARSTASIIGVHQVIISRFSHRAGDECVDVVHLSGKYRDGRDAGFATDLTGLCALATAQQRPLRLSQAELEANPRYQERRSANPDVPPLNGWLAAPVIGLDKRTIGLIQLSDKIDGAFTEDDEAIVIQLARMASVVIENLRLYDDLHEAARRKDDFLAMLGHELRNPLAGIVTGVQMLRRLPAADAAQEMQAVIDRQAAHMSRIVDDLLDVSRIARGKLALRDEPVNVCQIVRETVDDYRSSHVLEDCELCASLPDEEIWVRGDATRIAQVVTNLIHNGCKFADGANHVDVVTTLDDSGQTVEIIVVDRGIGMTQETLAAIFEPFNQADNSLNRSRGGLGLGLALVKGIVELHGGEVSAASAGLGHGSQFAIRLPVIERSHVAIHDPGPESAPTSRRVLLIDDRRDAILPIRRLLELDGHQVATAADGPSGLARAGEVLPEVVLCDIGLTGPMTGYDVARALRGDARHADVYLVAVTGYGQEDDRAAARAAGFDFHVTKPVGADQLHDVMNNMPTFR